MTGRTAAKRRDNYSQSPVSLARFCSPTEVKFPVLDKRERKIANDEFFLLSLFSLQSYCTRNLRREWRIKPRAARNEGVSQSRSF